jgi:hypothetical protein
LRVGKNTTVAIAWCRGGPHHHLSEVSNTTKVKIVHFFPFPHTKKEKEDDQDEGRSSSPTHIKGRRLFFSSLSKKSVIDVVFIRHGSSRLLCNIMSAQDSDAGKRWRLRSWECLYMACPQHARDTM